MCAMKALLLPLLAAAGLAFAGSAHAATVTTSSTNWSGYAVSGTGESFSDVKGTWVEPALTCSSPVPSFSSFWVGLGGLAAGSTALEQIGTEADCANGVPTHSVWYELVPAPQAQTSLQVSPGDTVTAEVSVAGTQVTLSITDATTGGTFSTTATVATPDTSSAEWIAEAPSQCLGGNLTLCHPLPLAPFGTVSFSAASATGNAHTGVISDPAWTSSDIALRGLLGGVSATPSALGADGASFTVTTQATPAPTPAVLPTIRIRIRWTWWPPRRHHHAH